jgi:light-regulated signal transduction histidine kinase (bacteriophytochrome)
VLLGYSKVTRDLTERKNAERALKESNEQYRRLWEDLRHMNQHLAAANRELEQFTSVASHDLQEPVRTLQSYLQLIGRNVQENKTDIAIRYIEKAAGTAIRMRELIRNLLQYSQMGKTKGSNTTVDIAETVGIVLQNLKNAIELSGAVVHTDFKVNVLQADPHQMVQLFQNLLSNALKFTNGHQPIVEIKCSNIGGEVVCSVADNGIGIASDDLDKVFEIFKRLNTDRDYPGTGIGLAICKKIVDSHGGRIWVESVPGRGTTFFFTIVNSAQK